MGHYNYLANSNDGYIQSNAVLYDDARSGSGTAVVTAVNGSTDLLAGQWFTGTPGTGTNRLDEAFLEFTHTPVPTTDLCTSACFKLHQFTHTPSGDPWSLEVREFDWGGTVTAADWVPGASIGSSAPNLLAEFREIRVQRPVPGAWRAGRQEMRDRMSGTAPIRMMLSSNKTAVGFTPDGNHDEYIGVNSFEGAAQPFRPRIDYSTTAKTTLTRCLGAAVQMSDGTWSWLEATGVDGTPTITLEHANSAGVESTLATLSFGVERNQFGYTPGAQAFSLTRDPSDNLYIVGPAGSTTNGLNVQAFVKGSGDVWTTKTSLVFDLPGYDQPPNSTAVTWHSMGASPGRLVAVAAHTQGWYLETQMSVVSINAQSALVGAGTVLTASAGVPQTVYGQPLNTTGNGLDIMSLSGGIGYIGMVAHDSPFGEQNEGTTKLFRYQIGNDGKFVVTPTLDDTFSAGGPEADGNMQFKMIPMSTSRFAYFGAGFVSIHTWSGTKLSLVGRTDLVQAGITSLAVDRAQTWDAVYDPATANIQIYYLDKTNSRRLMRTSVAVGTVLPVKNEVQVATNIGPSGSTNPTLRIGRGAIDERRVRVMLGNRDGSGVLSTVTITDLGLNLAPNAPTLTAPGAFTAQTAKAFSWTFTDANPKDAQTAYEATILRVSDSAVMFTSGKVTSTTSSFTLAASTLSNATNYQWRVRVYDKYDAVSAWSNYQTFSTAAGGIVNITDPLLDGTVPASPKLDVTWTFTSPSGATQASFQVRVLRTDTLGVVFNSGYLAGAAVRTYTVQGLISGIEQRIEVTVQDSAAAFSSTAQRLVTPFFSAPDSPTVIAVPSETETEGAGIMVSVINPTPTGDLPPAGRNDIYRSDSGVGVFIKVGECAPNGQFIDYGVASGVPYDYYARAIADGESSSAVVEAALTTFLGSYLHLASDPAGTIRPFLYGGLGNSDTVGSKGVELRFVGRVYPVLDFGTALDESVKVSIDVPFSDTYSADVNYLREVVRSKSTYCFRDGRGRKVFGVVTGVSTQNSAWGSQVSFDVMRVDYDEARP
jgi:hypothetical protein